MQPVQDLLLLDRRERFQELATAGRDKEEHAPQCGSQVTDGLQDLWQLMHGASGDGGVDLEAVAHVANHARGIHRVIKDSVDARNESWVLADAPSRDSETALVPASYSSTRTSRVSRSVTEGDRAMLRPSLVPCATSSGRSGRSKGSPPVRTTSGRGVPNEARSSKSRRPSSVVSSKGLRVRMASARQWVHTSWQARVTSQMTMKGRSDASWCMSRTGRVCTTVIYILIGGRGSPGSSAARP